jgi:hypothetical protein
MAIFVQMMQSKVPFVSSTRTKYTTLIRESNRGEDGNNQPKRREDGIDEPKRGKNGNHQGQPLKGSREVIPRVQLMVVGTRYSQSEARAYARPPLDPLTPCSTSR